MREASDEDGGTQAEIRSSDELMIVLLGGYVHDVASPLAVLTSNLPVVRSLPIGEGGSEGEQTAAELAEIVDDLELATARLRELTGDLRLYVGASAQDKSLEEIVRTALRLAHSHLSRRVEITVDVDPSYRPVAAPWLVLRAICATLVAITIDNVPGKKSRLALRVRESGLAIEMTPPPTRDPSRTVEAATKRVGTQADVSLSAERIEVHLALRWLGRDVP